MKEKFAQEEYVTFFFELTLCSLENHSEFQTLFSYLCLDDKINPRLDKLLQVDVKVNVSTYSS